MKTPIETIPKINISFFKDHIEEGQTKINFNDETDDYEIRIEQIPSNLGKGFINYFICPHTFKRCRILYKPKGCNKWLSRTAFIRLRYWLQLRSGNNREWSQYHKYKDKVEALEKEITKSHYQGKETAISKRLSILKQKREYYLKKALEGLPY